MNYKKEEDSDDHPYDFPLFHGLAGMIIDMAIG